jgi:VanZ family protein
LNNLFNYPFSEGKSPSFNIHNSSLRIRGVSLKKKLFKWILVILWMVVIFVFSSQNGKASSHNNRFVVDLLKNIGINLDVLLGSIDDYIIRKLAHMTEYFILFNLVYNAIYDNYKFIKSLIITLTFTFIYASSDEFHQSFTPGRGPSFHDVLIDTGGGGLALILKVIRYRLKTE